MNALFSFWLSFKWYTWRLTLVVFAFILKITIVTHWSSHEHWQLSWNVCCDKNFNAICDEMIVMMMRLTKQPINTRFRKKTKTFKWQLWDLLFIKNYWPKRWLFYYKHIDEVFTKFVYCICINHRDVSKCRCGWPQMIYTYTY